MLKALAVFSFEKMLDIAFIHFKKCDKIHLFI